MASWSDPRDRLQRIERLIRTFPIAVVGADARRRLRFWNSAFEQLFLYEADDILGQDLEGLVGRDDREIGVAVQRIARGEHVRLTTHARRKDGSVVDVDFVGAPDQVNGRFAGYWGLFQDVTERSAVERSLRRAEAHSSVISRVLFANQERERARIARVLHDDIGQLLVACQLALDRLAHDLSDASAEIISRLDELRSHAREIFTGVQAMSQDVYSPTDGLLSIGAALQQLCVQTRKRFDIDIGYVKRDVPDGVPADVSRCLFRLAQDALLYIATHSGTRRADVTLEGRPGMIHLYIREFGGAFSVDARSDEDVGLVTMRERAALINGTFSLTWFPSDGTQIEVAIPIGESPRVSAATQKTGAGAGGRPAR